MSDRRFRSGLLAATVGAAILLGLLGFVFWRTLPPIAPSVASARPVSKAFKGIVPLPSVIRPPNTTGVRVAILREPENQRISGPGVYDSSLAAWRAIVQQSGGTIVDAADADVIVAPQAVCLGPVQRRLIAAHLAKGRGLVTTGAFGARDGVCGVLRDTLLESLTGVGKGGIRPAVPRAGDAHYAVVLGESVLGAGSPAGARLEFAPSGQIVFHQRAREMLYTDYYRNTMNRGTPFYDAAAVRAVVGNARVAAFGYSPTDLIDKWSHDVGVNIVTAAIRWAAGHRIFQLSTWPHAYKAAAVLSQDVEADFQNARNAVDALEKYKLPGTAFIVGKLAEADPTTTRRLIDAGFEIGTHTQHHWPLDTLSNAAQLAELATSKKVAERLWGKQVDGMRPPEERYTPATLQAWADVGGTYVFANNNLRSAVPEIIPLLPDSLVLLGRVSEDDFEILSRDHIRNRREMSDLIVAQVGESVAYRGLYVFSYHSHMFSQRDLVPVLTALAEKLKDSPEVWTTTTGAVARWWRARANVTVQPSPDGTSANVTNHGPTSFEGGVILVDTPTGERRSIELPVLGPGRSIRIDGRE